MHRPSLYIAAFVFVLMLVISSWNSGQGVEVVQSSSVDSPAPIESVPVPLNGVVVDHNPLVDVIDEVDEPVAAQAKAIESPKQPVAGPQKVAEESPPPTVPEQKGSNETNRATAGQAAGGSPTPPPPSTPVSRAKTNKTDTNKYPKLSPAKGIYGQFHYRDLKDGRIEIDPHWVEENMVTITLPGVNRTVQVHKAAKDNFIKAFTLIANGHTTIGGKQVPLLSLIKSFDGIWVPRHINWDPRRGLSNHSWGAAVDINAADHFRYVDPHKEPHDPNLILWYQAFQPAGFKWGNSYSDAMHYELY